MKGGTTMEIKKIHQEFSVCQVEDYSFVNLGQHRTKEKM